MLALLSSWSVIGIILLALAVASTLIGIRILSLRRVVSTNEVHIVQTRGKTTSYGKGESAGNVYYEWPSWLPVIGMTRVTLPVSNFSIDLPDYAAYDKERVPFLVHIMAFFRIADSNTAAQRVSSSAELKAQLTSIVQGAVRTVLAAHEIDQIMLDRSRFGEAFTKEVEPQLANWGVEAIKNIELMDIRDAKESEVIHNIMAKRTSAIERESRVAVAENSRGAQEAEIAASQAVKLRQQEAEELIGKRTAEKVQKVGIATELANQEVKAQQKVTATREQDVIQVNSVRTAEITRDVSVVQAEQNRKIKVIAAEADNQAVIIAAEARLNATKKEAEGVTVAGAAKASAEAALLLAPVTAQITLAKEIGENNGYQTYLLGREQIDANKAIGIAQAAALEKADIKVISNAGAPAQGLSSIGELFTPAGGMKVGAMLEGLVQTETGKAIIDKVTK